MRRGAPVPALDLQALPQGERLETELDALLRVKDAGLPVAPTRVVPAALEEAFYRLNNLPERLVELFRDVRLDDPDEDDIEELAPDAERILLGSFLLDEIVDAFYEGLESMPARLRVRRPGEAGTEAARGREALLALKSTWAESWSFEPLLERLRATGTLALASRPVLVQPAGFERADAALAARVSTVLGDGAVVYVDPAFGIVSVRGRGALPAGGRPEDTGP